MIIYGIDDCPDCMAAMEKFKEVGFDYEYRNLGEKITWLREFIHYRDTESVFEDVIQDGLVGIPFFVTEKGYSTLDLDEAIRYQK